MLTEQEIKYCFNNLVEISSILYDLTTIDLAAIEKGDSDKNFAETLKDINKLKIKEKRILDKLHTTGYYDSASLYIDDLIEHIAGNDFEKINAITKRLESYYDLLAAKEEEVIEYIYDNDYDYDDYDEIFNQVKLIDVYTPLQINFLKRY